MSQEEPQEQLLPRKRVARRSDSCEDKRDYNILVCNLLTCVAYGISANQVMLYIVSESHNYHEAFLDSIHDLPTWVVGLRSLTRQRVSVVSTLIR